MYLTFLCIPWAFVLYCSYAKQLYVKYEMVCPEGYNVIEYSITDIDMEEANCPDPNSDENTTL